MTKELKELKDIKREEPKTVVYVGPNVGAVLRKFCVFKNGLPDTLTPLLKEKPTLSDLFVDVDQLPQVTKDLENSDSAISILYSSIDI
jgi:hypothetical protein